MTISLSNQKGFSLIEALIAMLILSVGLLAVAMLQVSAMKANTNALSRTDGVSVAQSVLDTLRTLPMSDARLSDGDDTDDLYTGMATSGTNFTPDNADHSGSELYGSDSITGPTGQTYTIFWNVADNDDTNSKTVRLFVYWTDQKLGLDHTIVTTVLGGLYL